MFDPIFKLALVISIGAHVAVITPVHFFANREESAPDVIQMNYVVIEQSRLALEEEVYEEAVEQIDEKPGDKKETAEQTEIFGLLKAEREEIVEQSKPQEESKTEENKREAALLKYHNLVREKIRAKLHSSEYVREEGETSITFTISPDGRLLGISSDVVGDTIHLKQQAISGIKLAAPFPAFPSELGQDPITFSLNIKFAIQ